MTLMEIYQHPRGALRALQAWLFRRRVIPSPLPSVEPRPARHVTRKSREEIEGLEDAANLAGSFYFREQILDDLEYYMQCIKRMRKADPGAYALYSQLGAHLLPQGGEVVCTHLTPWWKANRPAFGAVAATHLRLDKSNKKAKIYTPRFWYFQKLEYRSFLRNRLVQVPPEGSDIYRVTTYWDQPRERGWKAPIPTEFLIAITPNHRVFPLKEYTMQKTYAVSKNKQWGPGQVRGRRGNNALRTLQWDIPGFYKDWAKEHNTPVEDFMAWLFFAAASMFESGNRGLVRVEAGKNGNAAVFSVDIKRTPYFFKDRGVALTESGNRKRIFHIVRPHTRVNGAVVPMHFRGERQFDWNGFAVRITVPGLHHVPLAEFTPGSVTYGEKQILPQGLLDEKQVGTWLRGGVTSLDGVPNSMKNTPDIPPLPGRRVV